jgi:predicted metal-dependent phosphoesterase TrpH
MRADLHIHTDRSGDGRQSLDEVIRRCSELGLGAVSVTDHNGMNCYPFQAQGVIVLPGMEITTADGHVLAYLINEPVPRGRSVDETIDLIHEQGGIAVAAHPYRWWSGLGEKNVRGRKFDALETLNSRSLRLGNLRAARLARTMGLPGIGGSDAHITDHIGRALTIFPDDCQNAEDLARAIRTGAVSTEGRSRGLGESLSYGTKSIFRWARRGFRRM